MPDTDLEMRWNATILIIYHLRPEPEDVLNPLQAAQNLKPKSAISNQAKGGAPAYQCLRVGAIASLTFSPKGLDSSGYSPGVALGTRTPNQYQPWKGPPACPTHLPFRPKAQTSEVVRQRFLQKIFINHNIAESKAGSRGIGWASKADAFVICPPFKFQI